MLFLQFHPATTFSISSSATTPRRRNHPTPFPSQFNPQPLFKSFPCTPLKNPNSPFLPKHSSLRQTQNFLNHNNNHNGNGGGGGQNGNNNHNGNGGGGGQNGNNSDNSSNNNPINPFLLCSFTFLQSLSSAAKARTNDDDDADIVYEVKGGNRITLVPDYFNDAFVIPQTSSLLNFGNGIPNLLMKFRGLFVRLMLPEGFPDSVTSDYLEYSLWRGVQGVAAQISGVLATQALLYAVGLGKGAIPTAAAINWVLKDGIGYLSKILLSNFGRHFDVNPKGWRLFADFLENAAYGMEIITPVFPHLFVPIGAAAGAGRSAAALIQAATRSCFYAGFAAQRNFAEVIAKGEAQGMVSKGIGIMLGIALANCIHSSTPLALASFGVVTWIHMFCNLKSYQSIQLRTLNSYRASLVFSEYLLSGLVPLVKEVNDEEPLFPAVPLLNMKPTYKAQLEVLSALAKDAAANIECRLQLGSKLSDVVRSRDDVLALFELYRSEGYILTEHEGRFCVILKESSSQQDMLKSLFHVSYLYWLEQNAGIKSSSASDDCKPGGRLQISLEYVQREFNHIKSDSELAGWVIDGLIARPLPNRICTGYASSTVKC